MAGETELERIVVRLIGDGSSFNMMMQKAVGVTQKATTQMITALNRVEGFANTLLGAFGTLGVASSLRGAFDQFAKLERGQIRLNAIIETNGGDVAALTAQYRGVAEAISAVTLNTKGEIMALFQQAEAQQFSGEAAENVVRNSVALAGATGQSAESMLRVAAMIQRGHPEFAKRVLGLRGVADGTALVDAINRRMAGGMAVAQAEFNSASGRMERLGRSLKSVGVEVGGLIAGAILPLVDFVQKLTEQFKLLDQQTKNTVYKIFGITLAFLSLGPVKSVLMGLLGPIISLVHYLTITLPLLALNTAAWVIWKSVVIAFGVAASVVNGVIAVFSATVSLLSTVLSFTTAGFVALFAVIGGAAFFAIVGGFQVIKSLLSEISTLTRAVGDSFQSLSGMSEPLGAVTDVFNEWVDLGKNVLAAARVDLPAAWDLLAASATLAVAQVKNLWPPLWDYIKAGFVLVTDFIKDRLSRVATEFTKNIQGVISSVSTVIKVMQTAGNLFIGGSAAVATSQLEEIEQVSETLTESLDALGEAMAAIQFQTPGESIDVANAREAVSMAQAQVEAITNRLARPAERAGRVIGSGINKGIKGELQKFDAALFGTAEALARIEDYVDTYHGLKGKGPAQTGANAAARLPNAEDMMDEFGEGAKSAVTVSPSSQNGTGRIVEVLMQIRDLLRADNSDKITVATAGLK